MNLSKKETHDRVQMAVGVARRAMRVWQTHSTEHRVEVARRFAKISIDRQSELAEMICAETRKPRWESIGEAKLIAAKVDLAVAAMNERTSPQSIELPQGRGTVVYRPIGVMAVLGPFNFPAHLPNGHIVPALIAGNAVLFKPSEWTPRTGELLAAFWHDAGLPEGLLQVLQGDPMMGQSLVESDLDGVLFTGSHSAGRSIHRSLAGRPEVMLALEMGGNNPMIVDNVADLEAAASIVAVSAYITAGQRCTCARRLILPDGPGVQPLIDKIASIAGSLRVGTPDDDPEPFMGPVISAAAGERVLQAQADLLHRGAAAVLRCQSLRGDASLLSPGLIDVTNVSHRDDTEIFGPVLQVIRVADLDAAIDAANDTSFGLAAGLLSDDASAFAKFRARIRAGVVNWNQPTVGASGRLPFGGCGSSGNHRPSGFHAADYCASATAGIEETILRDPSAHYPGLRPS